MDQTLETLRSTLADRYRVEKAVGRGGMATVYLAHDLRHDRRVAIKVMDPELSATIGADRFTREVKIAGKLAHPNILGVYDSGETQRLLYYVMPFVDGETLRDKLVRERQLSIDDSIAIICEVADALGHAHSQGVVHRDIKPENILLQDGRAMVADFGIARLAEAEAEKLTKTGMAVGTAQYMSPEQASGEPTDARSDIYALGCTLFEMLSGQAPFTGNNAMAIMSQHALATVPEIKAMRMSVPDELDDVIRRAMEKTPADRFQTMEDFKRAVLGEIPATTTTLPKYTARYRVPGARSRRDPRKLLIGSVAAIGVLVAGTLLAQRYVLKGDPAPDAERVAVLYFSDETGGALEHVADGLTESLIRRLEAIPVLKVAPANGVRQFRGRAVPGDSVRIALGSGSIVRGTVSREGARVRVDVSLFDAESNSRIKGAGIVVDTANIVSLQDSVAEEVEGFLREEIGDQVRLRTTRGQTRSTAAWMLAERAAKLRRDADSLYRARSGEQATVALVRADSLLLSAQSFDTRWGRIPSMRAGVAFSRALLVSDPGVQGAMIDSGLARADAAIRLQADDADAYAAKGVLLHLRYLRGLDPDPATRQKTLDLAETSLRQAVQADNKHAGAWAALSGVYYAKPNIEEALNAARNAYQLDNYLAQAKIILNRLFWGNHDLGFYPEALRWCDQGYARFPTDPFFTDCRLWMYTTTHKKPDVDSAWTYQRRYVQLHNEKAQPYADLHSRILVAGALARAGLADSARSVLANARPTPEVDPSRELAGDEAVVRAILGDKEEAIRLIESYLTANPTHRQGFATRVGPWWRSLQDHPRFRALTAGAH